jgi:hypothetical protein
MSKQKHPTAQSLRPGQTIYAVFDTGAYNREPLHYYIKKITVGGKMAPMVPIGCATPTVMNIKQLRCKFRAPRPNVFYSKRRAASHLAKIMRYDR